MYIYCLHSIIPPPLFHHPHFNSMIFFFQKLIIHYILCFNSSLFICNTHIYSHVCF